MNQIAIAIVAGTATDADKLKIEAIRYDKHAERLIKKRAYETGTTFNDALEQTLIESIHQHFTNKQS